MPIRFSERSEERSRPKIVHIGESGYNGLSSSDKNDLSKFYLIHKDPMTIEGQWEESNNINYSKKDGWICGLYSGDPTNDPLSAWYVFVNVTSPTLVAEYVPYVIAKANCLFYPPTDTSYKFSEGWREAFLQDTSYVWNKNVMYGADYRTSPGSNWPGVYKSVGFTQKFKTGTVLIITESNAAYNSPLFRVYVYSEMSMSFVRITGTGFNPNNYRYRHIYIPFAQRRNIYSDYRGNYPGAWEYMTKYHLANEVGDDSATISQRGTTDIGKYDLDIQKDVNESAKAFLRGSLFFIGHTNDNYDDAFSSHGYDEHDTILSVDSINNGGIFSPVRMVVSNEKSTEQDESYDVTSYSEYCRIGFDHIPTYGSAIIIAPINSAAHVQTQFYGDVNDATVPSKYTSEQDWKRCVLFAEFNRPMMDSEFPFLDCEWFYSYIGPGWISELVATGNTGAAFAYKLFPNHRLGRIDDMWITDVT